MLKGFLISLVIIVLTGAAITYPQTQAELNLDACKKFKGADEELNRTYKQILTIYRGESEFIQKFRRAQRAWIAFRDLHIESIYPKTNRGEYGSVNPMCRCQLLTSLTIERTKVLKEWLNGEEEGDVCAGSIKSTSELHRLRKDTPR